MVKVLLVFLSACAYDASYSDCAIRCANDASCPEGLACGSEGLCREPGATEACAILPASSCDGLPATCGPAGTSDCCESPLVTGGTFYRSYDVSGDGMYSSTSYPATVSDFRLDKYEVTVARFRQFVNAGMGTQAAAPTQGAGAHAKIAGSGWDASWNGDLVASTAALVAAVKCDATYQTWTDTAGANEALPMNCITWYEAMAFCIWDGGYPPTEAEWNFSASGGDEQRAYPWSNPTNSLAIDCSFANYDVNVPSGTYCVNGTTGGLNRVGGESPKGDGKWGQSDLVGNVWEWTLDWYAASYPSSTCDDCANLDPGSSCPICPARSVQGGSFSRNAPALRAAGRGFSVPAERASEFGVRCARL